MDTDLFSPNMMAIMHNVSTITDIKTEIGYSRAWIRLALEQKVNLLKKCLNVRQKLGTISLSHSLALSLFHSLIISLSTC